MKLLVVGAREGSLGSAVKDVAAGSTLFESVFTAGVSGEEDYPLDVCRQKSVYAFLRKREVDHVICTTGINLPGTIRGQAWRIGMTKQMHVNFFGPMTLLAEWSRYWRDKYTDPAVPEEEYAPRHFVVVSSNSAHIPRTASGGYCASKAALSMGVRCAAREIDAHGYPLVAYGYEPGWIEGTPMSEAVKEDLAQHAAVLRPHRIPSGQGISRWNLAALMVNNIINTNREMSGCMLRVDGGEI
jgi:NAD(P)-dependent dehydrogenase (short-subunit alcohol dehydrogenase family)